MGRSLSSRPFYVLILAPDDGEACVSHTYAYKATAFKTATRLLRYAAAPFTVTIVQVR